MGLHVSIYRPARFGDCTNGGISSRERDAKGLCLVNVNGPFDPSDEYPAALLIEHLPFGPEKGRRLAQVVPAELEAGAWKPAPGWWMFGGHYAATSDSRMGEKIREILQLEPDEFPASDAIKIMDRREF